MPKIASMLVQSSSFALALAFAQTAYAQASPSNYTSGIRYNALGKVAGTIAPDPDGAGSLKYAAVRNTYNNSGYLIKVEQGELSSWQAETVAPSNWTGFTILKTVEYTYDSLGRKLTEHVKGSDSVTASLTQSSYNVIGLLECSAVRMNPSTFASPPSSACTLGTQGSYGKDRVTKNVYDAAGQLLQVRKAVGTSLEQAYATYSYTPNGKREYVIDAIGNRAKLEYDGYDRQSKWIFPSTTKPASFNPSTPATALSTAGSLNTGDYELYGYDPAGNRTSLRKRDGSTLTYQYDALNRMTLKVVPDRANLAATHERDVYYTYDARGLMTATRFDSATGEGITSAYDGFGRITSGTISMDGASRTLTYLYDKDGNRTRLTYPDSNYITYAYDGLDRPQIVSTTAPAWSHTYAYNQRGELISDTISGTGGSRTFGRDPVGRLSSLAVNVAGTASDVTTTIGGYNPASQIAQESRNNDAYAYTARVNVSRSHTANGLNQYSAVAGTNFCYDANGNLTGDGAFVYLYDIENRLVEKRSMVGGSCTNYTGTLQASMRYDPMGRLYETDGTVTGLTRYLADGDALAAEYNGAGTLLRRYVHGADGAADDPIAWYEGAAMNTSTLRFLFADRLGTITLAGDNAGNALRLFKYDEYGIPQSSDAAALTPANGARFLYTGQAWLPDAGIYYYKARMYSPTLGRFLQTDPIGYEDQMNLYAYVGNDPVNKIDPTGNDAIIVVQEDGSVQITVPITFSGDAATPSNIATISNSIQNTFTGTFDGTKVTTQVVQGKVNGVENTMTVTNGPTDRAGANAGHSYVRGGNEAHVTMIDQNGGSIKRSDGAMTTSTKGNLTGAHEGGHLLGLPDTNKAGPGIMDAGKGGTVTGSDINTMAQKTTPSGAINDVKRCATLDCP